MKKLIPFIIITIVLFFLNSCFKANDNIGHDGRCTGSAYCTACSNCSKCGHCSSGGTCGVCKGPSSERNFYSGSSVTKKSKASKKRTASRTRSNPPTKTNRKSLFYAPTSSTTYYAKEKIVNIHKGPGFEFPVIEKVKQGSKLSEIEENEEWIKIKVWKTGTEGFVYYTDITY